MKRFKLIDAWLNAVLIAGSLVYAILVHNEYTIAAYFIVGGWQIVSMIVHQLNSWFVSPGTKRRNYHTIIIIILISALLGIVLSPLLYLLMVVLLFAAPFMAIYYACICYDEVYHKMQRPLAILK